MTCAEHEVERCPVARCQVLAVCGAQMPDDAKPDEPINWSWIYTYGYFRPANIDPPPYLPRFAKRIAARLVAWMRWPGPVEWDQDGPGIPGGTFTHMLNGMFETWAERVDRLSDPLPPTRPPNDIAHCGRCRPPCTTVGPHADEHDALWTWCEARWPDYHDVWEDWPPQEDADRAEMDEIRAQIDGHHDGINWGTVLVALDYLETQGALGEAWAEVHAFRAEKTITTRTAGRDMTIQIETHRGPVYRTSNTPPMRAGETAVYQTAADITLAEFFTLLAGMGGFDGEPPRDVPEDMRWTVTVTDSRAVSR